MYLGTGAKEDAWTWMGRGLVHFVSSDAHNTARRPLKLKFAYDAVTERFGEEKAKRCLIENPLAAFEGRPLPLVPEFPRSTTAESASGFFFSKVRSGFSGRGEGQSGPGIEHAEHFANDIHGIAGISPPVSGSKGSPKRRGRWRRRSRRKGVSRECVCGGCGL